MSQTSTPAPSAALSGLLARLREALLANPIWTLMLAVLLATGAASGTAFLTFRSDERVFFATDNPDLDRLQRFESRYGKDNNLLVLIEAKQGDVFTPQHLAAIAGVSGELWSAPYVKRVDSLTNFQVASGDAEGLSIDQLWRQGDPTDAASLNKLRETAKATPLLMGRLLSKDLRATMVAVNFRLPADRATEAQEAALADVRARMATWRQAHPDLQFHLSGSIALDAAFGEASARDGMILIPMMFTVLLLLLGLMLTSWVPVLSATLVIGGAIGAALGIAGFLGIPLTSVSVAAPFVITIVGMCDAAHFSFTAAEGRRHGMERREAVVHAVRTSTWPIFLASLTTAVGFFSLLFSDAPPFAHLGLICGLGSAFAFIFSMTITPALLILLPWGTRDNLTRFGPAFGRVAGWAARRPVLAMALALVPALGATAFIGRNVLDDRYTRYFDDRFEFRRDTDALNRVLGGFYTLEYDLPAPADGGISSPAYLNDVDRFANWMRGQAGVTHVASHADRIKMIHRALENGDPTRYVVPSDSAVSAQLLTLYEMNLPYGQDLREQITPDHSASRLTVALEDLSSAETLALAERARAWIERETPSLRDGANATGLTLMFSNIGMRNIDSMVVGTAIEFAVVGVLLLLAFRNLRLIGISMIANIVPGLAAIGGWGLLVGEIGMAVATIVAVTLGIAVDDTIHIVLGIKRAFARTRNAVLAAEQGMTEVGPGVLATTVCLACGFFILAFSGFQINAWLGMMTGIVIIIAFIFDVIFIPAAVSLLLGKDTHHDAR